MKLLVTGYNGFIGKNFCNYFKNKKFKIVSFGRESSIDSLSETLKEINLIFHFAGENRSDQTKSFQEHNVNLTKKIIVLIEKNKLKIPIVFSSTIQFNKKTSYGISKRKAEIILEKYSKKNKSSVAIMRLPNIFGKWSKPNYNSVIATFSYNISRNLPIEINKKNTTKLLYIDDLLRFIEKNFINSYEKFKKKRKILIIDKFKNQKKILVEKLAEKIIKFKESRANLYLPKMETKFDKNLYSTYVSFLPEKSITYNIDQKIDERGAFCEIFKNDKSGQISYLTINPNKTRGNHYHNSKIEKFLLIEGKCKFVFKNLLNSKKITMNCNSKKLKIVETIPGWSHKIVNISKKKCIVLIWTNEIFDVKKPDTYFSKIN